ncbi:MAG: 50S ribosomal protein L22 [Candidatus Nealsonbacteria bacterium]|nr:MAG: 50S ribosomal protein L22 [Candidatus Nealsonbacteria bacterium]
MISSAKLRYLRIAPRKVRLVADLIRGEKVEEAQTILNFTQKRAALPILKLLNQALANAKDRNLKLDKKNIYVSKIFVDGGPSYKRTFPRARGKADIILKRTSHITIVLEEVEKKVVKKKLKLAGEKPSFIKTTKEEKKTVKIEKDRKKETLKAEESREIKEKMKKRLKTEKIRTKRIRPKRERGIKRFFRRKAI